MELGTEHLAAVPRLLRNSGPSNHLSVIVRLFSLVLRNNNRYPEITLDFTYFTNVLYLIMAHLMQFSKCQGELNSLSLTCWEIRDMDNKC